MRGQQALPPTLPATASLGSSVQHLNTYMGFLAFVLQNRSRIKLVPDSFFLPLDLAPDALKCHPLVEA